MDWFFPLISLGFFSSDWKGWWIEQLNGFTLYGDTVLCDYADTHFVLLK